MAEARRMDVQTLPLLATLVALGLTVAVVGSARLAGVRPDVSLPGQTALHSRLLQFEDASGGSVVVRDARTSEIIQRFASGEGAFLRATLRALVNDRRRKGITRTGAFRLEAHPGPQLFLIDEASGRTISLNAFGPDNTAVFAAFMSNQKKGEGQ